MFIIMGVSFAVYFNALFDGFVSDDTAFLMNNSWIRDPHFLTVVVKMFTNNILGFREGAVKMMINYYRPMASVISMCTFHVVGLKPFPFHLINVLFHVANTALVFMIALKLLGDNSSANVAQHTSLSPAFSSPAFIAAVLFAAHPIHTEAVTWISGGGCELSFSFFYLLSLWLYMQYKEGLKSGYFLSLISFFASTLCKETALTLPLILIGYDIAFGGKGKASRAFVMRYIPYFFIAGIYLALRINALKGLGLSAVHMELSAWQYVINVFPLLLEYLKDLFFPFNLNYWHTFRPIESLLTVKGLLSMTVTAGYLFIVIFAWKRNKVMFFCLLLIVVPLLPALYIKAIAGKPYAERYLYLPSFGFVVILAICFDFLNKKMTRYGIAVMLIVLLFAGLYSVQTITRNSVWKDSLTIIADTVNKSPEADVPRYELGKVLMNMGRNDEAIQQFRKALELNPGNANSHNALGAAYIRAGSYNGAIEQCLIAIKLKPDYADPHFNLGVIYYNMGQKENAKMEMMSGLKLMPDNQQAQQLLDKISGLY